MAATFKLEAGLPPMGTNVLGRLFGEGLVDLAGAEAGLRWWAMPLGLLSQLVGDGGILEPGTVSVGTVV